MRLRLSLAGSGALGLIVAVTSWYFTLRPSHGQSRRDSREPEETEISPERREAWDLMRLRDPATGAIPAEIHRRELAFAATIPGSSGSSALAKSSAADDHVWAQRGPYNVGGRTRALAYDADNERTLIAGGATGGVWRSSNAGGSWQRTTSLSQIPSVTCIAQDTRVGKRKVWYYGTGEFRTNSTRFGNTLYAGDGIFKSTDGGVTWAQLPSTAVGTPQQPDQPFNFINAIAIDSTNHTEDEVYAAVRGGIMRSMDGGISWRKVLGEQKNGAGYTDVRVGPDGAVYAGIGTGWSVHGIWRSANGTDWTNITPPGFGDSTRRIVIGIAPSNPNVVYVLAETPGSGLAVEGSYGFTEYYSLWKYTHQPGSGSGGTWEDRSANLYSGDVGIYNTYNGLDGYAMLVKPSPTDENTLFIGGSNLWVSTDGFATQSATHWLGGYGLDGNYGDPGSLHPDQHTLLFSAATPGLIYSGNDGGIFTTMLTDAYNGNNWTSLANGYLTTQFYSVALDHASQHSALLVGGAQDNGSVLTSTTEASIPWIDMFGGDGSFCAIADGGTEIYVSAQYGAILHARIDQTLNTVMQDYLGFGGITSDVPFVTPFLLDPNDNSVMYASDGTFINRNPLVAEDAAEWGWGDMLQTKVSSGVISALEMSASAPAHRLYYGTTDGHVFRLDGANTDNSRPIEITGGDFPAGAYVNCVAVDPLDADRVMVVFTNYNVQSLFLTTDGGATWNPIGGNLEQYPNGTGSGPSCRWGAFLHRGNRTLFFVGTSTGLYSTEEPNGTATVWSQEGASSIGSVIVDMIDTRQSDGTVAVATWANGIFSSVIPVSSGVRSERATAGAFRLGQSHPNPCRGAATIDFTIPPGTGGVDAELSLYDEIGNRVATLLEGRVLPGDHSIPFTPRRADGTPLPSGSYYYRLRAGGFTETRSLAVRR